MTVEQIIGLVVALVLMSAGLAGSILPGLPSTPLVLVVAICHKLYFGGAGVGWLTMSALVGLTVLSLVMDYLASVYGAKSLGATWRGMWGAAAGGLIGIFFNLPGILLGPFVGATLFELVGGRHWKEAGRAGLGATIGLVAGVVGKIGSCALMMVIFTINVIYRSWP